jgi:hypothetical protein
MKHNFAFFRSFNRLRIATVGTIVLAFGMFAI